MSEYDAKFTVVSGKGKDSHRLRLSSDDGEVTIRYADTGVRSMDFKTR